MGNIFFPSGIVTGKDFCNRKEERNHLKNCISENTSVVLSSPRRYGKTSLITQVGQENHIPFYSVDLLPTDNQEYVKKAILDGAGRLLYLMLPKHKRAENKMLQLFKNLNPKITIGAFGQTIEFFTQQPARKSIMETLLNLDHAAKEFKKRAIFVMDEFQQVGSIHNHHVVEASIRHAVERSRNITYFFSGSNRHLLAQMFQDSHRPLYRLCELLRLERISHEDFLLFLQEKAEKRWGEVLDKSVISEILDLTQCHPFYVNNLCRILWRFDNPPDGEMVIAQWRRYVESQHSWIVGDFNRLSANRRTILAALAYEPINEPQSQLFSKRIGLLPASIKRALETLLREDYIYKDQGGFYKVLDPTVLYYLNSIKYFNFD